MTNTTVCLISVFKNESHIIQEWIEHYLKEGVNHFFLVDNGSTDDYIEKIQTYIDRGIITLIIDDKKHAQIEHLNKFLPLCKNFDWVIVVDLDELVYSRNGYKTIKEYLNSLSENVLQVYIPWKMYGSNSFVQQPSNVINNFILRNLYNELHIINGKCITRGKNISYLQQHYSNLNEENGLLITSNNEQQINENKTSINISEDILKNSCLHLNHYAIQSWEYFYKIKMTRGDVLSQSVDFIRDENYFKAYDFNHFMDDELKNKNYA